MKKYLYDYIDEIELFLKKKHNQKEIQAKKEEMLIKIKFFQHERLIHLLVTLFYALMLLVFLILIALSVLFILPAFFLLCFLVCYIIHYFRLENGVQYLYNLYDNVCNLSK